MGGGWTSHINPPVLEQQILNMQWAAKTLDDQLASANPERERGHRAGGRLLWCTCVWEPRLAHDSTSMSRSAHAIQSHLYASLLHARTPDVVLRVRASWHATYRLHRVVLIQSGFFNSLFTAGFAESSPRPEEIDIIFDDTNITRAGVSLPQFFPHSLTFGSI